MDDSESDTPSDLYLHGLPLWIVGAGIFLPMLEISIVSTSLVTIGSELHGFDQISWVPNAYILTYSGFLMIWSRAAEIFGVKATLLSALGLFIAFSGGCAAAQTLNELIILRAFQGTGAAGVFTISIFSLLRLMPPASYDIIATLAGIVISLGLVLGPICGGAINDRGSWSWIFLLNVPAGAVACVFLLVAMPPHYPNLPPPHEEKFCLGVWVRTFFNRQTVFLFRVDILGAFLILAASMLLIAALQEGTVGYTWSSGVIITFFILSGLLWVGLVGWIWLQSRRAWEFQPILPWRLVQNRVFMGCVLGWFLSGAPLIVSVIDLPQRYQTVNKSSPLEAGVKLLAYSISNPIGAAVGSASLARFRVPFVYMLFVGSIFQSIGFFLMSTVPETISLWKGQFGYAVIFGVGVGLMTSSLYMLVPESVEENDQLVAMGTATQARQLGGALAVAISSTILNSHLSSMLDVFLTPGEIHAVKESSQLVDSLPEPVEIHVRRVFAGAYNEQMRMVGGFALAQLLAVGLVWRKRQIRIEKTRPRLSS